MRTSICSMNRSGSGSIMGGESTMNFLAAEHHASTSPAFLPVSPSTSVMSSHRMRVALLLSAGLRRSVLT